MKRFLQSVITLSITATFGLSSANSATYQVIDKGAADKVKYTYAQQENNSSAMALSGTGVYNFPVQFQYLKEKDFDRIVSFSKQYDDQPVIQQRYGIIHDAKPIEDESALRAGNPTANDLEWVKWYLRYNEANVESQKVGDVIALSNIDGQSIELTIFDQTFTDSDFLTYSTTDFVNGITDDGWVYGSGSAPYLPLQFIKTDKDGNPETFTYWVREFSSRGFYSVDNGQTIIEIVPSAAKYGGVSAILGMNSQQVAVGFESVSYVAEYLDQIEDPKPNDDENNKYCLHPERLLEEPIELCTQKLANMLYKTEAVKWLLNDDGVISKESLGYLVTPHQDDPTPLISVAQAINNNGVAVGYATGWQDETETEPSKHEPRSQYAVVFKDGQVIDFTEDHSEYFNSRAYDINDLGIAVGHAQKRISGAIRTKFYYVDTNVESMEMILPGDFFSSSSSSAKAINEHGIIVGKGEVETHNDNSDTPRRTHGFMYDINTQTFSDLNDFLPCDSAYTIIEANAINENNEISATAIVKETRRDAKGEEMFDDAGQPLLEDVVRAVKLAPTNGTIDTCTKKEAGKVERKGAGFGTFSFVALALVAIFRRTKSGIFVSRS